MKYFYFLFKIIIFKEEALQAIESSRIHERCQTIVNTFPAKLLGRALNYLYVTETKSSFEIERITPSASRVEKFVGLLGLAEHKDFCEKTLLIELQNRIVDPRFQDKDYRTIQNYIGQTASYQKEVIHYVCPSPRDLPALMAGLLISHKKMKKGQTPVLIHAATTSYGFVFLHPFEDGNGRIHRFLIHNILSSRKLVPQGLMFPISATLLKESISYDRSLEAFSTPLMKLVEYELDELGQLTLHNDVGCWYRYMDLTAQAEALYRFVQQTIETELVEELHFLAHYDEAKRALQAIIDMPDRRIDLFIRFCLQNQGALSKRKRNDHFAFLTNDELSEMEKTINTIFLTSKETS